MPIHYAVHLSDQKKIDIQAAKINLGLKRLWFFDTEENLIAVFRWDNIQGFSIEGSASGQIITDDLPHEQKAEERKAEATRQARGPVRHALETAEQSLKNVTTVLGSAFLALSDMKNKSSEAELFVTRHRDELLRYQAQLKDRQRDVEVTIGRINEQLIDLLKTPK